MTWIGLGLAFVSTLAVNWAYAKEHDAATAMPRFSARRPLRFVATLVRSQRWRTAFATETAGWLVYVAALRLAPLSLVQAICASGIGMLAYVSVGGRIGRLSSREQAAVLLAFAGLALLALSLTGNGQSDKPPYPYLAILWIASCAGGALALALLHMAMARAAALGLAAGLLFAGGDISAKLVGYGGTWTLATLSLIVTYGLGTSLLQGAFQHGGALTAAGLATLATNAIPIAAGFALFDEHLPTGLRGAFQVAAFATVVVSAVLLSTPATHAPARVPETTSPDEPASSDAGTAARRRARTSAG